MSGRLLLIPTIACLAFAIACSSGDDGPADGADTAFDVDRVLAHAETLAVNIGARPAGSANELAAADYLRDELASYGYEAELQPFPIETYETARSDLAVTHADGSSQIEATPLVGSSSGTESEQLVSVGLGYPGDFPVEASGKIVLIERGEIEFSSKVANAEEAGAVAAVIYNNASGPFVGQLSETPGIPVLSIAREDGESLLDLMVNETLTAMVDVEINVVSGESQNVVARPADGACRIVVGGHYDSVPAGPGANDNGSGTAVVVELARTLAAGGGDDVCFALFGAEEIGLVGSLAYVAALAPDELSGIEAMLNFDMLAVGAGWPLGGSSPLVELAGQVAEELAISYSVSPSETGGSDHGPFIDAGVPAVIFNCFCDENYHTVTDRFDSLERGRLAEAGALGLGLLEALLAA